MLPTTADVNLNVNVLYSARSLDVKIVKEAFQWDLLPHSPYSPDIVPSDYHLLQSMIRDLSEQNLAF